MKIKNKNQTMGYISSEEDRTIFQERENFIKTMTLTEYMIFNDFEQTFAGNMVNGFSYSKILKSFLTDYQSLLQNRSMDLSYWFVSGISEVYEATEIPAQRYPTVYNVLFAKDLRYKALIRTDGKLAPFVYCLGRAQEGSWGFYPENTCHTIKYFRDMVISLKSVIPTVSSLNSNYTVNIITFSRPSGTYYYVLSTNLGIFNIDVSSEKSHHTLPIPNCNGASIDFDITPAVGTTPAKVSNLKIVMAVGFGNSIYNSLYESSLSPNAFIAMLTRMIDIISFFEGENTAMNVDGNYDGLAANSYEVILQDQLNYLNTINDAVSQSLINEKIESQNQKDDVMKKIADKKAEIGNFMSVKKQAINNLNTLISQKAELARNV